MIARSQIESGPGRCVQGVRAPHGYVNPAIAVARQRNRFSGKLAGYPSGAGAPPATTRDVTDCAAPKISALCCPTAGAGRGILGR